MNDILAAPLQNKPSTTTPAMCEFQAVHKTFLAKDRSVTVLRDINFTVPVGSFTILYGPSGSGKTTILNTMIGLETPSKGKVIVNGRDVYSLSRDQRAHFRAKTLGMVHQDNYWVNSLSVIDNIALPLILAGWTKKKAHLISKLSLARVGLESFADYNPTVLSGGQQQRVSFARATVIRPKLLVADEPTGNLDTKNGDLIIGLLQDFNRSYNATVVLVTHNLELLNLSDNIISIKDGQVVETKNNNPSVRIMTTQMRQVQK
jgi:putative ABC transport system ATP-binding protein